MQSAILIKGRESPAVPFLCLPNGQSHDGVLERGDARAQRREGGGDHAAAAAAAVLWEPLSGGVAAVTTQRVSVRCHRRPGGNRMKEALPPGSSPRASRRHDVRLKRPTAQREVLRSPVYIS